MARYDRGKGANPYINHREHKVSEIKRSLTHKARLRRNYFKLLEKEGIDSKKPSEQNNERDVQSHGDSIQDINKPLHIDDNYNEDSQSKRVLTYGERLERDKQKKDEAKKAKLREIKETRAHIERRRDEKKKSNMQLSKKTKKGQPVMAPRISQLLEKIKREKAPS